MQLDTNRIWHEQHAEGRNVAERKLSAVFLTVLLTLDAKLASKYRAITSCKIGVKTQQNKKTDLGNF